MLRSARIFAQLIEFSFRDEKNAIDPRTVSVQTAAGLVRAGQDGVRLEPDAGNPRAAVLRLEPGKFLRWAPQTAPTAYSFTVNADDMALDDARTVQTVRLVLMPAIPDGAVFLSALEPVKAFAHAGLKRDLNYLGGELRLTGVPYLKGLMLCPETTNGPENYGEAVYDIPAGRFRTFHAVVGIDDAAGGGSVVFSVQVRKKGGEWETRFKSPLLCKGSAPQAVAVPLGDAAQIRLYTDAAGDIGCDHAVFGLARFEP